MIKTCETCKKTFEVPRYDQDRRFCSHDCYALSMKTSVIKSCEMCGKPFEVNQAKKDTRQYCSKACGRKALTTRITKSCEHCGKSFETIQSMKDRRYCSTKCGGLAKVARIEKVCEACGKPFEVIPARKNARHCSKACQTAKVQLPCAYCGNLFYAKRHEVDKGLRKTCSRSCNSLLRAKEGRAARTGKSFSEDARQRISKTVQQYYQENPTKHPWYKDGAYANGELRRGPSWEIQRKRARERDNHTCRICGKTREQAGKNLAVHHIIPYRKFASPDEANALENLITVCQSCHMKLEHNIIAIPPSENELPFS